MCEERKDGGAMRSEAMMLHEELPLLCDWFRSSLLTSLAADLKS